MPKRGEPWLPSTVWRVTNYCRDRFRERVDASADRDAVRECLSRCDLMSNAERKRMNAHQKKRGIKGTKMPKGAFLVVNRESWVVFIISPDKAGVFGVVTCWKWEDKR